MVPVVCHTHTNLHTTLKKNNNKYVSPSVSQTTNFLNIEMMDNMQLTNNQTDWQTDRQSIIFTWNTGNKCVNSRPHKNISRSLYLIELQSNETRSPWHLYFIDQN